MLPRTCGGGDGVSHRVLTTEYLMAKVKKVKVSRKTALMEEEGASFACSAQQTISGIWKHCLRCLEVWSE